MLLRKLGGNLYCLRLSNCEPCNGNAQSDMQLKATKSRRNQVSPKYYNTQCYYIKSYLLKMLKKGFDIKVVANLGIEPRTH